MPSEPAAESRATAGTPEWHALDPVDVLGRLGVSLDDGIDPEEAARRVARVGPNAIERRQSETPLRVFLRQFQNPLLWVLIASSIVAVVLGKVVDGLVVLAVVLINSVIGFIQEYRAGQAIEALSAMVPEFATVRRGGQQVDLPVTELVPGDVVLLDAGDRVPADMRLLQTKGLRVDEAALTGESVPAEKGVAAVAFDAGLGDRSSMGFGGTLVVAGTATAVVVATGQASQLGRISQLLGETIQLETPLTHSLAVIGRVIAVGIVALAAVMVAVGTARALGQGISIDEALRESVVFAIALAVGAIPEGLPAIVTIALAIGVQRMARRRAIIRRLPAVETLGSTTVICTDKTGTLTRNEMTVQELWTVAGPVEVEGVGYAPSGSLVRDGAPLSALPGDVGRLLLHAALCNDASLVFQGGEWRTSGDPTEVALVVAAEKAGIGVDDARSAHPRLDVLPFDSDLQFMATLNEVPAEPSEVQAQTAPSGASDGGTAARARIIVKGAPEVVLQRCAGVDGDAFHAEVDRLANRGMRVLAVASKACAPPTGRAAGDYLGPADVASGLELDGLVGMIDPPRPEAMAAVAASQAAGITVKMITGDHAATARAIGEQLGLVGREAAVTGAQLAALDDEGLRRAVASSNVFARVAPEHKLRLVRALQADGAVVAMTGDGVNDAPALRQADIGVAMGITGTAVAKESADMVLTDDNFATIEAAVEEGRRVYDNLVKALAFVLPTNLALALILAGAVVFFPFDAVTRELLLPIDPTQLLWINLVATVALALPLAYEAMEPDVMRRPPRRRDAPVLSGLVLWRTAIVAVFMAAGASALFLWEYYHATELGVADAVARGEAQTMAVTSVIAAQVFYLLNCRSLRYSVLAIGLLSNPTVFAGIGAVLLLQLAFVYLPVLNAIFGSVPLAIPDLLLAALVGAAILPIAAVDKRLRARSSG